MLSCAARRHASLSRLLPLGSAKKKRHGIVLGIAASTRASR